jgi:hypothetical protein
MTETANGLSTPRPGRKRRPAEIGSYFDGWRAGYRGHPLRLPPTVVVADWLAGYSDGRELHDVRRKLQARA